VRRVPPPGHLRRAVALALCAPALAVLAACSGGGDVDDPAVGANTRPTAPGGAVPGQASLSAARGEARALADRAVALMSGTSYRLTGTTTVAGDTTTLDIRVSRARDAVQTTTGPAGRQERIKVGGELYVDVESMITGMGADGATVPADLRGAYLRTDPRALDDRALDPFAGGFGADAGDITKGAVVQVDGKDTWPLSVTGADGATTTMYVLAQGDPYAVRLTVTGEDPMDVTVTDIGADVTVTAPDPGRVIDQATLRRRLAAGTG
jgi:hypothetical protein